MCEEHARQRKGNLYTVTALENNEVRHGGPDAHE